MIDCDEREKQGEEAPKDAAADAVCAYVKGSEHDVLGSYTGMDNDGGKPQQDADDL